MAKLRVAQENATSFGGRDIFLDVEIFKELVFFHYSIHNRFSTRCIT
jgi:hypothetical protein